MLILIMSTKNHNGGQNMKTIMRNEQAQAGVGTLIIFIAMVLVAAVAAAVLIQTSGVMQSKSTSTTKEAAAAIAENIVIDSIDGSRSSSGTYLSYLNTTIKVAAGGSDIDISKVLVTVKSGSAIATLNYNASVSLSATTYKVVQMRGSSAMNVSTELYNLSTATTPTLKAGDLVKIVIDASSSAANLNLGQKGVFSITLAPEKGTSVTMPATLPAFGTDTTISIYP